MSSSTAMPATHGRSEACCNVPPVVVKDYETKGTYDDVGNLKTYVTGPEDSTKGILVIYDIFGYFPQTLQGADILAFSDEKQKYRVLMPDWFEGNPAPIEWYPPDTEQKQKDLGAWFSNWPFDKLVNKLPEFMKAVEAKYPGKEWALVGYCWGGKIAALTAATELFKAAVSLHPANVDPEDAKKVKVPIAMLASQDEDANDVKAWGEALKVPNYVERFDSQIHGWMAARGNLEDENVRDEYVRGYKAVLKFLSENL